MLTFDIGFGTSVYPVVLEVRKLHKLLFDPPELKKNTAGNPLWQLPSNVWEMSKYININFA